METLETPEASVRVLKIDNYCSAISSLSTKLSKEQEEQLAVQIGEINDNLENIIAVPALFSQFYNHALPITLNFLQHGPKNFLNEHSGHQIRKHLLEILFRTPFKENVQHLSKILPCIYHVIENDNEQNALVALKIVNDLHRRMLPQKLVDEGKKIMAIFSKMAISFLANVSTILEPREPIPELTQADLDIPSLLTKIFYKTELSIEGSKVEILPRGLYSLKILTEVPIFCILLNNIFKNAIDNELWEMVRMGMSIISHQPSPAQLANPLFQNGCYIDVIAVQAKFLYLIGYFAKNHEDQIATNAAFMSELPQYVIALLKNCPDSAPQIRKDILIGLRSLINTSCRKYFAPHIEVFFDDKIVIGSGWTSKEALRVVAFGIIYDLLHHIRESLTQKQILAAMNYYTKNMFDERLHAMIQIMTCRLMLNMADTYIKVAEKDSQRQIKPEMDNRTLLFKIFYLFATKIDYVVKYVIPAISQKVANTPSPSLPPITTIETLASAPPILPERSPSDYYFNEPLMAESTQSSDGPLCYEDLKIKFGFPDSSETYSIVECRMFLRTVLQGIKVLASKMKEISDRYESAQNNAAMQAAMAQQQQATAQAAAAAGGTNPQPTPVILPQLTIKSGFCRPNQLNILIQLFKQGLKIFEIYNLQNQVENNATITSTGGGEGGQKKDEQPNKDKTSSSSCSGNVAAGGEKGAAEKSSTNPQPAQQQRTKEEKELIECFTNIFLTLPPHTFRAVMRECIDHLVHCISENNSIQLVANNFLSTRATSLIFSNILVEFLLARMEVMGSSSSELSNLYLRLFKLVFGSVSLFPNDNEIMLKPHLHKIVNNSMKLALDAKDPYNYFQLLRALFRSIGGGSHDLLYQEFLPMLPSLLQGLNRFQAAKNRQNMKDLFVELCLTIPVRLSSLLPYLPWLMDPLVSALNGTPNLISQGLRTLELCVDNLQPDFLYEHIQPIRTELMQALWRTLRHPVEHIAHCAFRVLGKLGGSNHKLMIEPQKLEWIDYRDPAVLSAMIQHSGVAPTDQASKGDTLQMLEAISPPHIPTHNCDSFVSIHYTEAVINSTHPNQHTASHSTPIYLPIDKVIEAAYRGLRQPGTDTFYRQQCWEIIKGFFVAHIETITTPEERQTLAKLFANASLSTCDLPRYNCPTLTAKVYAASNLSEATAQLYKFPGENLRKIHELALTAMLTAAAIKDLHNMVISFIIPLVRHYTLVAICQQAAGTGSGLMYIKGTGRCNGATGTKANFFGMDPLVLIDAAATVMGQEESELCKPCLLVFRIINDTTTTILGSKERASQLPLYEYILERLVALCYERPWFSKHGGCSGIRMLMKSMSLRFLFEHQFIIVKAMLFVVMDMTGDLSSGVIDMAKETLEILIKMCAAPLESAGGQKEFSFVQRKSMFDVTQELVRNISNSNTLVREESMHLLRVLAQTTGQSVTEVMAPFREALTDMIPPKKHKLLQQPPNVQIGLLEASIFCTTLEPPLFTIDVSIPEHSVYLDQVYSIAESDDASLQKQNCYKGLDSLVPLKKSCFNVLAACHFIPTLRTKTFLLLYKALDSSEPELQESAFQCLDKYKALKEVDSDLIRNGIRNLIRNISDHRTLTAASVIRLKYHARLFTYIFNDKFCDQFMQHLLRITEGAVGTIRKWKERDYKLKLAAQQQAHQAQSEGNQAAVQQALSTYENNSKINHLEVQHQVSVCIEIINLFTEITAASSNYVEQLITFLLKVENLLDTFGAFKFYEPIRKFMLRYPQQTITFLERYYSDVNVMRFFQYLISGKDGAPFRAVIFADPSKILEILRSQAVVLGAIKSDASTATGAPSSSSGGSFENKAAPSGGATSENTIERFHAIKIISTLIEHDEKWLSSQPELVRILRAIWMSENFYQEYASGFMVDYSQWNEPELLAKCLLAHFKVNIHTEIDTIFQLLRAFDHRCLCNYEFLKEYLSEVVMKALPVEWKRAAFLRYVKIHQECERNNKEGKNGDWSSENTAQILKYVIIPMFAHAFECGEAENLLGQSTMAKGALQPNSEQADLVYILATNLIDSISFNSFNSLYVLQLCALIAEHAPAYLRVPSLKKQDKQVNQDQNSPVRKLMHYAWFCMNSNLQVDPATCHYANLLLTVFINRMAINKRIVRSVFLNLMKATTVEARPIVRAALDLLIYSMSRSGWAKDGKTLMAKMTRQNIIDESHQIAQFINFLQPHLIFPYQNIIRHHRCFYESRHTLMPHLVNAINRFGLSPNCTLDHRRIALDLVEVVIRWEYFRKQEATEQGGTSGSRLESVGHKRAHEKMDIDSSATGSTNEPLSETSKNEIVVGTFKDPISKEHADAIVNFLVRFACLVNDLNHNSQVINNPNGSHAIQAPGQTITTAPITADYLGRRSLALLKIVLQSDIWPDISFRIPMIDRALSYFKEVNNSNNSVCMALELLTIFLQTMKKEAVLKIFNGVHKSIAVACACNNSRVVHVMHTLLVKLMAIFPPSCASTTIPLKTQVAQDQLEPLEQLYADIHSNILAGFDAYEKATCIASAQNVVQMALSQAVSGASSAASSAHLGPEITNTLSSLNATLMILKAACINQPSYIDRLLLPFIHMFQKLVKEHLILSRLVSNQIISETQTNATFCVDLIVLSLDLVKSRLGVMSPDMRRNFISNVFITLIDKSPDVRVMKAILQIFEEWIKQPLSGQQGRSSGGGVHHPIAPLIREKVTLLTRISMNIEKRMSDDIELNALFLDLIYYIYTDDTLRTSDLAAKLELSFMAGLRCSQPSIRQKFSSVLDNVIRKRLYDRLMYIICEQNWETMMGHYWIRQCIELVLAIANHQVPLSTPNTFAILPLPTTFITSVSDHYEDKYSGFSSGASGGADMDLFANDILLDFDFIGTPSAHVQDRNAGKTDVEMADISNTSDPVAASQHQDQSAAANSLYNDLFGCQAANSTTSQTRDRSSSVGSSGTGPTSATAGTQPFGHKQGMVYKVADFLLHLQQLKSAGFINALIQLCYLDSELASHIWIQLFTRIYSIIGKQQQQLIALQLAPFVASGAHLSQQDAHSPISALGTFYEAVACCRPTITLRPSITKYIGKNHNVWHRVVLMLEEALERESSTTPSIGLGGLLANGTNEINAHLLQSSGSGSNQKSTRGSSSNSGQESGNASTAGQLPVTNQYEVFPAELSQPCISYGEECLLALGQMYELLHEEDYWAGIWQRMAHFDETKIGISYERMGFFEQAKGAYELAMSKARNVYCDTNPAPHILKDEYYLWEQHWVRCSKELNQWDFLLEYANNTAIKNPSLVMESAWRIPDWDQMHEAIQFVEQNVSKEQLWKLALYKGYDFLCNPKHRDLDQIGRLVELAANNLIKEWRRLPPLVGSVHVEYLHAAHQVAELHEAGLLHQSIFNSGAPTTSGSMGSLDLRSIIKTWKNRLPVLADDLSHWSDIFTWRQHHYQAVVSRYEAEAARPGNQLASQNVLVGAHASAQSLILYAKVARKHSLVTVSLDSLNRIHTIPKVPIIDCFQKIRQQLKCYLLLHQIQPIGDEIQEGLSVIESTHLKYFQRDMISEFYAMKGHFLMKLGQMDEANRTFSVATQIQDTLVKAWALWGEYYEELFTNKDNFSYQERNLELGSAAIIAYLHACRHQNESKARKYLSKVLWLQSYDDDAGTLAKTIDKYNTGVPPINWLPWVPQLLTCLTRPEGNHLSALISQISKLYPQAVYYPVRTLYLTLRLEAREFKFKQGMMVACGIYANTQQASEHVLASSSMVRCTKLMHAQREHSPIVLNTLEGIIDQLSWFRENWYEEVLRQLHLALAKCYTSAFEHRANITDSPISPATASFVRKLISTFGTGAETVPSQPGNFVKTNSGVSELLSKRVQATLQDPIFQKLKHQFSLDFDFSQSNKKLHILILKLKKWIKILEAKTKLLPKSWLLEEKCRFLANFGQQMVDIALPGELFMPKINIISIARFMPRVDVVAKHNSTARRLSFLGTNGRVYPYLVLSDSSTTEARREERFLQLQRFLNFYFCKNKETARRLLNFAVPRVVSFAAQTRFVEDNVTSLSLIEIYKQNVTRKGSDPDAPIAKYYDRLVSVQTKGTAATLAVTRDIIANIQASLAPKTLIKEWAVQTYNSAPDFWHFRKQFTLQLALANFSEFAFHLNRLNPDMMYIHRDSGLINVSYFRFDISEDSGEFSSTHHVPFRLTYSIQDFVTAFGVQGPMSATMTSAASCLTYPNFKVCSILKAILRDEIINWNRRIKWNEKLHYMSSLLAQAAQAARASADSSEQKDSGEKPSPLQATLAAAFPQGQEIPEIGGEDLVNLVNKATNLIMSRLSSLSIFEGTDSKVSQLISLATSPDNLARMDPAWHPWL